MLLNYNETINLAEKLEKLKENPNLKPIPAPVKENYGKLRDSTEQQRKLKASKENNVLFTENEIKFLKENPSILEELDFSTIKSFILDERNLEEKEITSSKINFTEEEQIESFLRILITLNKEGSLVSEDRIKEAASILTRIFYNSKDFQTPTITKVKKFLINYVSKDNKYPINDLLSKLPDLPFRDDQWKSADWSKFILSNPLTVKKLKILPFAPQIQQELGNKVPKTYNEAIEALALVRYPEFKKLTEKERTIEIRHFAHLSVEHNLKQNAFNEVLDISLGRHEEGLKLKEKDNIPDIFIDGSEVDPLLKNYYLAKLRPKDLTGFLLGKLTNCCQSIGAAGSPVAINGMINANAGYYAIYEKGALKQPNLATDEKGALKQPNLATDRIISESFGWIGEPTEANLKTFCLDSFERLGKEDNRLFEPFYSKLALKLYEHGYNKINVGASGTANTPLNNAFPLVEKIDNITFQGEHPYPKDSSKQRTILDTQKGIYPDQELIKLRSLAYHPKENKENFELQLKKCKLNDEQFKQLTELALNNGHSEYLKALIESYPDKIEIINRVMIPNLRGLKVKTLGIILENYPPDKKILKKELIESILEKNLPNKNFEMAKFLSDNYNDLIPKNALDCAYVKSVEISFNKFTKYLNKTDYYKPSNEILDKAFIAATINENNKFLEYIATHDYYKPSEEIKNIAIKGSLIEYAKKGNQNTYNEMKNKINKKYIKEIFDFKTIEAILENIVENGSNEFFKEVIDDLYPFLKDKEFSKVFNKIVESRNDEAILYSFKKGKSLISSKNLGKLIEKIEPSNDLFDMLLRDYIDEVPTKSLGVALKNIVENNDDEGFDKLKPYLSKIDKDNLHEALEFTKDNRAIDKSLLIQEALNSLNTEKSWVEKVRPVNSQTTFYRNK